MKKYFYFLLFTSVTVLACSASNVYAADADWAELNTGIRKDFSQISCPDARTCYAVSGFYLVGGTGGGIKTTDGGDTFTTLKLPTSNPLHTISCPSVDVCYAAGDFGTLLNTTDGGTTWTKQELGSRSNPPQLTGIFAVNDTTVYVVGREGFIYKSRDGGDTWKPPALRMFADFFSVYFSDEMTGFITGNSGALAVTVDGGETWQPKGALSAVGTIGAIHGAGTDTIYTTGKVISKSVDAGDHWDTARSGTLEGYRTVTVADDNTVYAVGESSNTIFKTTNGGTSWASEFTPKASSVLRSIACPEPDYCIAVGTGGKVFRLGTPPPAPEPEPEPVVVEVSTTTEAVASSTVPIIPVVVPEPVPVVPPIPVVTPPQAPVVQTPVVSNITSVTLKRTLKKGSRGTDVRRLQEILSADEEVYPEKIVSGYFGALTKKAVGLFQAKHGIANEGEPGYGQAGPKTRAKLNEVAL